MKNLISTLATLVSATVVADSFVSSAAKSRKETASDGRGVRIDGYRFIIDEVNGTTYLNVVMKRGKGSYEKARFEMTGNIYEAIGSLRSTTFGFIQDTKCETIGCMEVSHMVATGLEGLHQSRYKLGGCVNIRASHRTNMNSLEVSIKDTMAIQFQFDFDGWNKLATYLERECSFEIKKNRMERRINEDAPRKATKKAAV